jgi:hypothetical protein
MDISILQKHIHSYKKYTEDKSSKYKEESKDRLERRRYYQSLDRERLLAMSVDEFEEYISKLWAMLIWGNKKYVADKIISDNGLATITKELAELVWGVNQIPERWDRFRNKIKGMGPAMMSEILCHVHPDECMLWNRRAYVGLNYLGVENLPKYNYQLTGARYLELSNITKTIVDELRKNGFPEADLLNADYFIWEELQVQNKLSTIYKSTDSGGEAYDDLAADSTTAEFIHDEVRDKIKDIGKWLGLESRTEVKVADGSRVDAIWEQTIGNMGRVVYVFEVQTKGNIDSLIINLLKSVNNPAVQAVVAVSDEKQLEKIKKHTAEVNGLKGRLKFWDYQRVLQVHEALESVNEEINSLGLVSDIFW